MVAEPDDELPEHLRRTHWIDLRRGLDPTKLKTLGRHLDEPGEFFRLVGSPPPHKQRVLPTGVQGLFVTLWASIGSIIGFVALTAVGLRAELDEIGISELAWSAAISVVVIMVPILLLLYFWIFQAQSIRRWMPPRSNDGSTDEITAVARRPRTTAPPPPAWTASGA